MFVFFFFYRKKTYCFFKLSGLQTPSKVKIKYSHSFHEWYRQQPSCPSYLFIPRGQSVSGHVVQAKMWKCFPPVCLWYVTEMNWLRGRRALGTKCSAQEGRALGKQECFVLARIGANSTFPALFAHPHARFPHPAFSVFLSTTVVEIYLGENLLSRTSKHYPWYQRFSSRAVREFSVKSVTLEPITHREL